MSLQPRSNSEFCPFFHPEPEFHAFTISCSAPSQQPEVLLHCCPRLHMKRCLCLCLSVLGRWRPLAPCNGGSVSHRLEPINWPRLGCQSYETSMETTSHAFLVLLKHNAFNYLVHNKCLRGQRWMQMFLGWVHSCHHCFGRSFSLRLLPQHFHASRYYVGTVTFFNAWGSLKGASLMFPLVGWKCARLC